MAKMGKTFGSLLVILFLTSLVLLPDATVKAQPTNQAPSIEWQKTYGGDMVVESSNLIQTSDGGYAFMDIGYYYDEYVNGATIFKVDSNGNVQWSKTVDFFIGSTIVQTSDNGYEISGWWLDSYAVVIGPTLIKTDAQGNIQWNQNYTTLPNLGVNYYPNKMFPTAFDGVEGGSTKTSDGGFVSWTAGSGYSGGKSPNIIKTDSNNNTQWTKTLTYQVMVSNASAPLILTSVIETSDGALTALGVAPAGHSTFPTQGTMYLTKLEPFLPLPSPTQLPTPIPTVPELSWLVILPLLLSIFSVALVLRHRKTANLKQ